VDVCPHFGLNIDNEGLAKVSCKGHQSCVEQIEENKNTQNFFIFPVRVKVVVITFLPEKELDNIFTRFILTIFHLWTVVKFVLNKK
jgi:hypothetical protein